MSDLPPPPPPFGGPPPPPVYLTPPPGYVAYGGTGFGQGPLQKIGTLGKWLRGLLVVMLGVQVLVLVAQFLLRGSALDYTSGKITPSDFNDKFALLATAGGIALGVSLAEIVVLCIWTFRMAKNLAVLGRSPQSFKPGVTIVVNILGGCTLGIANYFMWRELWIGSDPTTPPGDPSWRQRTAAPIVLVHLILTISSVVVGLFLGIANGISTIRTAGGSADVAKNLSDKIGVVGITGVLQIAAAVVFILLVRGLGARHLQATREA